jgi:type 1 glutamine amidotransferase
MRFARRLRSGLLALIALAPLLSAAAADPAKPARFLAVTFTAGYRHGSIGTGEAVLEELGRTSGLFHIDFLREPARFKELFAPAVLADFDGLMFVNTTGNLPVPDLAAMLEWVKAGKAFVGMHAATDTFNSSDAYGDFIGGIFAGHPWGSGGEHGFVVHEPGHPVTAMYQPKFRWKDEIYQYDARWKPENVRVLISLDMPSSKPREPWHIPVSWIREYGAGRLFYTNFGHNDATWKDPTFQKHLQEGIAWSLKRFDAPAAANPDVQAAEYLRSVIAAGARALGREADTDRLVVRAEAKVAMDPSWAPGMRPQLLAIREQAPPARAESYKQVLAAVEAE